MRADRSMVQSRLSVRDGSIGGWWRPDACAAGSAAPSDGAPTLVPSDGSRDRSGQQSASSEPSKSSLSLPHVPPCHIYTPIHRGTRTRGRTQPHAIHTYTHINRIYTATRARPRTYVLSRSRHRHPARVSIHPTTREGVRVPGSSLSGCSAFANTHGRQPRAARSLAHSLSRAHACTRC